MKTLTYPIKLYIPKKFIIITMIGFLLMFLIFLVMIGDDNLDKSMQGLSWFYVILSPIGFLIMLIIWLKNEPTITIYKSGVECFRLAIFRGNQNIDWSDIAKVELIENSYRSTKYWQVEFIPKNLHSKPISRMLKPMIYHDLILNEKEIFYLIEQSFFGKQPIYQEIEMDTKGNRILPYFIVLIVVILSIGFLLTLK